MTNKELLELRARREKLERETKALVQKQKSLETSMHVLKEKVSIEELEKEHRALKRAVANLVKRKKSLESKLSKVKGKKKVSKNEKETENLEDNKTVVVEETMPETSSDLEVTTVVASPVVEQKPVKKKRRFF
jgi:chromosome segregation ATPase